MVMYVKLGEPKHIAGNVLGTVAVLTVLTVLITSNFVRSEKEITRS